jgi:LytTr DNA-binding domain
MELSYFKKYPKRPLFLSLLVLLLLWIFSVFLSYLYQLSTNTICSFRLLIIFISGLLYWVSLTPIIISLTAKWKHTYSLPKQLFFHGITGAAFVAVNQLLIPVCINSALHFFYGCSDSGGTPVVNALTNNILVNVVMYSFLSGTAFRTRRVNTTPPAKPTIQYPASISIKSGASTEVVPVTSIRWIEANQNCIHIHNGKKKFVQYSSLKKFYCQLDPALFIQVHRSAVVNRTCIKEIINLPSGDGQLVLDNDIVIRFSRHYRKNIV